jgi:hypothetical protein
VARDSKPQGFKTNSFISCSYYIVAVVRGRPRLIEESPSQIGLLNVPEMKTERDELHFSF